MRAGGLHLLDFLILPMILGSLLYLCPVVLMAPTEVRRSAVDYEKVLKPIAYCELRRLVLERKKITERLIQSPDLVRVLQEAQVLLKEKSHARLILSSCRIEGPTIRLTGPFRNAAEYHSETAKHLRERQLQAAIYIGLPIEIYDSSFTTDLELDDVVFQKTLTIKETEFRKSISFQGVVFEVPVVFDHVHFEASSNFSGTLFLQAATFENCEFSSHANFSLSYIGPKARLFFAGDKLNVPLDFSESIVLGTLTLQGIERTFHLVEKVYLNSVNKKESNPAGELRLKNVEIHDSFYLDQGKWEKLDLGETQDGLHRPIRFQGFCDLRQGTFNLVDLRGVEFEGGGDFLKAEFKGGVDFERAKFRKPILVEWKQLLGKLHSFGAQQAPGKSQTVNLSKESYEELERNFKALGDLYGENETRYEKRQKWEGRNWEWAISGYWVRPGRAFSLLLLVLVLATAVNCWAFRGGWQHGWFWRRGSRETLLDALRVPSPVQLTLRAAALKPVIPDDYGATTKGRIVFWFDYFFLKAAEVILILTISNVSPILKQLIPYFVPV